MGTLAPPEKRTVSRRLPQPATPKRVRLVLDDPELALVERMATDLRLSVASFLRALVVGSAADWPARLESTRKAAEKINATPPPGRDRPGRKKK